MSMNCQKIVDLLVEYLDGQLDPQEAQRLEHHLECCPSCVEFLQSYRQTGHVCRKALSVQMPAPLKSSLATFLRTKLNT